MKLFITLFLTIIFAFFFGGFANAEMVTVEKDEVTVVEVLEANDKLAGALGQCEEGNSQWKIAFDGLHDFTQLMVDRYNALVIEYTRLADAYNLLEEQYTALEYMLEGEPDDGSRTD